MFATIQSDFAHALLDPDSPPPAAVTACAARPPQKRFAVYRNNVVASLVGALRTKFPATERIVGTDFFSAMARVFVAKHPPRSKILHVYGDDFGDFVADFPPAAELPYLADVVRLEAARTRAYHAADAVPLAADAFAGIDPNAIGALHLALHPSWQLVRSRHPVVAIWAMNAGERELGAIALDTPEDALVLRPALAVAVRALPPGGAAFLLALSAGLPLAAAASEALAADPHFELTANLAGLIGSGGIAAFSLAAAPPTGGS